MSSPLECEIDLVKEDYWKHYFLSFCFWSETGLFKLVPEALVNKRYNKQVHYIQVRIKCIYKYKRTNSLPTCRNWDGRRV